MFKVKAKCFLFIDMIGLCLKLGHEQEIIDRAFEENGAPFEDISSLIDKLCALEEGESAMVEVCMLYKLHGSFF